MWARGTLVVLLAYVVVVVVGLVLGRKSYQYDRLLVTLVIDHLDNKPVDPGKVNSILNSFDGPVYVVNVGDSLTGRTVARQLERSRQLVELVTPAESCVSGIRMLGSMLAESGTGVLVYLCPDIGDSINDIDSEN